MNANEMMEQFLKQTEVIDLTLTLEERMPKWPTQPPFHAVTYEAMEWGFGSYHRGISMSEHTGTHMDAPSHFIPDTEGVDRTPFTQLMGRGVKIDATNAKPREAVGMETVAAFERNYGEIQQGDIVFFHFGWDKKYGLKPDGDGFLHDWPGIAPEVGEYLLQKRVKAVGCDPMALDPDGSDYPNHSILLGNGINILENVANLGSVPPFFTCIGLPLKIKDGSGSPIRILAFIDKK
ncbi:MAG: cyclase family protein [Lachnospiraceae bacterium]|nr:cyclase family protein [Lachnospiraceae bacterium]